MCRNQYKLGFATLLTNEYRSRPYGASPRLFGRDAADGDEAAKGELRAATYSELALGTSLTRNEPDRVDYPGKAPRGESAQPRIDVTVYYSRRYVIDDANKHVYRIREPPSRPRPFCRYREATVDHAVSGGAMWERRPRFYTVVRLERAETQPGFSWLSLGSRAGFRW